jgi:hypothetical protein
LREPRRRPGAQTVAAPRRDRSPAPRRARNARPAARRTRRCRSRYRSNATRDGAPANRERCRRWNGSRCPSCVRRRPRPRSGSVARPSSPRRETISNNPIKSACRLAKLKGAANGDVRERSGHKVPVRDRNLRTSRPAYQSICATFRNGAGGPRSL